MRIGIWLDTGEVIDFDKQQEELKEKEEKKED